MEKIIIFIFILIILLAIYLAFFKFKKSNKLSKTNIDHFQKILKRISSNISPKEKIMDYDKLYHKILKEIGYSWNFWDILKQNPACIDDIQSIWELHKLRNKLAHDFDLLEENVLNKKALKYKDEINKLLKNI